LQFNSPVCGEIIINNSKIKPKRRKSAVIILYQNIKVKQMKSCHPLFDLLDIALPIGAKYKQLLLEALI